MTPKETIQIELIESPIISTPEIAPETKAMISSIVQQAAEAIKIRNNKAAAKNADLRRTEAAVSAMLESITGIEPTEILAIMESESLSGSISKIKGYLKTDNKYTVSKCRRDGKSYYYLDPVR
jgi:hypothetical protein